MNSSWHIQETLSLKSSWIVQELKIHEIFLIFFLNMNCSRTFSSANSLCHFLFMDCSWTVQELSLMNSSRTTVHEQFKNYCLWTVHEQFMFNWVVTSVWNSLGGPKNQILYRRKYRKPVQIMYRKYSGSLKHSWTRIQ